MKNIVDTLENIQNVLLDHLQTAKIFPNFVVGSCGELLFLMNQGTIDLSDEFDKLLDTIEDNHSFSLSAGMTGMAWFFDFIIKRGDLDAEEFEDFLKELDEAIYNSAMSYFKINNFDFLSGGVGNAMYLLNRIEENEKVKGYLEEITHAVIAKARQTKDGVFWDENEYYLYEGLDATKIINLSLSHGLASKIVFFSKLYENNILPELSKQYLTDSVKFMLNAKNPADKYSVFPSTIVEEEENDSSRLSWCYGDLGISFAIWQAGITLSDDTIKQEAISICLATINRKTTDVTNIEDAGFCHGTAGVSHLYYRMYLNTGKEEFKQAASYWLDETMKLANFEDGLAGFKAWNSTKKKFENIHGVLEGIAGIGLVLQAQLKEDKNPNWDNIFLLS